MLGRVASNSARRPSSEPLNEGFVGATGEITVTYKAAAVGVAAAKNTLRLNPFVRDQAAAATQLKAALTNGVSGAIDWACASATQVSATKAGLSATAGTLEAKYAPAICR